MTPPLTRPITPGLIFVMLILPLMALAMPFARREDWIGWVAFLTICLGAVGLWVLLIFGWISNLRARDRSDSPTDH